MNTRKLSFKKMIALGSTTVFTLLAMPLIADITHADHNVFMSGAHAADDTSSDAVKGSSGNGNAGSGSSSGGGTQARKGNSGSSGSDSASGTDSGSGSTSGSDSGSGSSSSGTSGSGSDSGSGSSGGNKGSTSGSGSSASGSGSGSGSAGSGGGNGQGGKPTRVTTTEEEEGGKGQMGGGVHGQGAYQDNKQTGGATAPGPGGINSEPNDAKGPRFSGGAGTGSSGGKPIWAQEGIPEVELGRLNVARAPGKLLDKQLLEALASLATLVTQDGSLYTAATLADAIKLISQDVVRIDSPLENLALLKDFLTDGVIDGDYVTADGTTYQVLDPTMSNEEFAALLLGSASDKTVTITADTVAAMETLLGVDMGDDSTIATMADQVRTAILDAHED